MSLSSVFVHIFMFSLQGFKPNLFIQPTMSGRVFCVSRQPERIVQVNL